MADGGEEEDDYMSDKFVCEAVDGISNPKIAKKRHFSGRQPVAGQERKKSKVGGNSGKGERKKIEADLREKGLLTPLADDNRGFSMLYKMGYTPGMGLGKEGQGRIAPVSLSLKEGTRGLGREIFEKESADRKRQQEVKTVSMFMQNRQKQFDTRRVERDLWRSQLSCQQLDTQKGNDTPIKMWYWPAVSNPQDEEETEECGSADDTVSPAEPRDQLMELTVYLRSQHCYCVWCGTVFTDEEDMANSCPGNTAEDHD